MLCYSFKTTLNSTWEKDFKFAQVSEIFVFQVYGLLRCLHGISQTTGSQRYLQAFLSTTVFLRRSSFSRKGVNFRSVFWHEYPWIHSWYIYVAKTLKLINYYNYIVGSLPITLSFHEIQRRWSYFLRGDACGNVLQGFCMRVSGAMCSLTFNYASVRKKCFLAFTRKHLPQFRVSIL